MKYKLKDIGRIITGCTPKTKIEEYYQSKDYLFVGPSDLKTCKYIKKTEKYISNMAYKDYSSRFIEQNSIMVDCIGSDMGNVALSINKVLTNQQINSITEIDENKFNVEYIYYVLSTMKKYFHQIGTNGSTMPIINKTMFENIEIEVPEKDIQDKIVTILSRLDKKIELNNEINENLHEITNFIYKEMFDAKNELNYEKLGNHAECILGGTPSRDNDEFWNGNINWINSGEVNKFRIINPSEKITELGLKKSSTTVLPKNTTVLAITGATLGQVSRLEIDSCANQSVVGVVANKDLTNNYIYLSILNNIKDITKNQTGGAQQHINKGNVEDFEILIPTQEELNKFENKVNPLFEKISLNCKENLVLEQLRDTLLSKLMNGETDLDKVEIYGRRYYGRNCIRILL